MSNKELVTLKHCQIHLMGPALERAAETLYPDPHPEVFGVTAMQLGRMPSIDRESFERKVEANKAALANRNAFTGPHFHGVKNVLVGASTIDVAFEGGINYLYPLHTVGRVKVYTTQHTPE